MSLRKKVLHKYIDRIETTQTYINLITRNLLQYVNRIGKLRDSGDELVKLLSDYAQYGRNNSLLSANLAGFSKCLQVIEDERDSQVQRLNIGVLNELNQYNQNLKFIKNEISKAVEALEKELSKSKNDSDTFLNRCCSKGALDENENENHGDNNEATTSKTRTKCGVLFSQLQQKLRNYEEEKSYTIASILKQFILIQLTFNRQSQLVFACAYKSLTNTFVEFDITKELFRICKDLYYPNYKHLFRNLSPSCGSSSPSPPPTASVSQPQTSQKASKTSLSTPKTPPVHAPPPPARTTPSKPFSSQASSTTVPSTSSLSQQTPSQIQLLEQMKKMQPKWQQPNATLAEPVTKLPPPSSNKSTRKQVSDSPKSSRSETITNTSEQHLTAANINVNNSSLNNLFHSHDFSSSNNSFKLNKIPSYESFVGQKQVKQNQPQQQQQQQQQQSSRQTINNLKESIKQNFKNMMKRNTNRASKTNIQNKTALHEYQFCLVDEKETSSSSETVGNAEYDTLSLRSLESAQERYINFKIDEWINKNVKKESIIPSAPQAPSTQYSDNTNTLTNTTSMSRDSKPRDLQSRFNHRSSTDTLVKEKKRAQSEFHQYENVQTALIGENSNNKNNNWTSKLQDSGDEDELMKRFNNLRNGMTATTASAITAQSYRTNSVLDTLGSESTRPLYIATDKQVYGSESNLARSGLRPPSNNLLRIMTHAEQEEFLKNNKNRFNYRNTLSTVSSADSNNLGRSNSARSHSQTHRSSHETRL